MCRLTRVCTGRTGRHNCRWQAKGKWTSVWNVIKGEAKRKVQCYSKRSKFSCTKYLKISLIFNSLFLPYSALFYFRIKSDVSSIAFLSFKKKNTKGRFQGTHVIQLDVRNINSVLLVQTSYPGQFREYAEFFFIIKAIKENPSNVLKPRVKNHLLQMTKCHCFSYSNLKLSDCEMSKI